MPEFPILAGNGEQLLAQGKKLINTMCAEMNRIDAPTNYVVRARLHRLAQVVYRRSRSAPTPRLSEHHRVVVGVIDGLNFQLRQLVAPWVDEHAQVATARARSAGPGSRGSTASDISTIPTHPRSRSGSRACPRSRP